MDFLCGLLGVIAIVVVMVLYWINPDWVLGKDVDHEVKFSEKDWIDYFNKQKDRGDRL